MDGELAEIADGVHAWLQPGGTWWLNNAGLVRGRDGLVLVDTCATRDRTRRFLGAVREVAGAAPVRFAVNTHMHGDHTYGNALLPAETAIVGHPATREGMLADTLLADPPRFWSPPPAFGFASVRPPTVLVPDAAVLHVGETRVEVRHPGHSAHTAGDLGVWLPDTGVLFTGDLLSHGVTPMLLTGSITGSLRSLDFLMSFEPEAVVPGHGPLVTDLMAALEAHERYHRFVLDRAVSARLEGLTPLAAARSTDLGEFAAWPDQERLVLNLHAAYAEADGKEVDHRAALADAVALKGGPLSCCA